MYTLQCANEKSELLSKVRSDLYRLAAQLDKVPREYCDFRVIIRASFTNPLDLQASLNYFATGFRSEPHALVQRQVELAKKV